MRVGVVIGTKGSPAFVALQLEAVGRLCPGTSVLVHDDCSDDRDLWRVVDDYEAELSSTPHCLGHTRGDVSAYIQGLRWADVNGMDYLVKISRRFVPVAPWMAWFKEMAVMPTVGASDAVFGWNLRTEFIGLNVERWQSRLSALMNFDGGLVEQFMAQQALRLGGVAPFPFLGESRARDNGNFLWYNFASAERYAEQARLWGLPYTEADFDVRANLES